MTISIINSLAVWFAGTSHPNYIIPYLCNDVKLTLSVSRCNVSIWSEVLICNPSMIQYNNSLLTYRKLWNPENLRVHLAARVLEEKGKGGKVIHFKKIYFNFRFFQNKKNKIIDYHRSFLLSYFLALWKLYNSLNSKIKNILSLPCFPKPCIQTYREVYFMKILLHLRYAFQVSGKVARQEVQEEWSNGPVDFLMQWSIQM